MMILLLSVLSMFMLWGRFSGIFLYLLMFIYFLFDYNLLGMYSLKGDLYGVLGLDYISFYLIMLLLWIISVVMILYYSWVLFFFLVVLLLSILMMFSSLDFLYLFICFEFSMIPMFLIILFFGSYKERYLAGVYMFIYTMLSSLPMLITLMSVYFSAGSFSIGYNMLSLFGFDLWVSIIIMVLFLVKVPMFMVHIWLPKAHVEAPVFGSMILASVMLKMGGYGVIRCMDFMEIDLLISDFFFCFCLCGSVLISYFCLYQVDLKILVAYSSIIHMGFMLMGFFSGIEMGYLGGVIMMISHGMCSSGMFYLVNEIYKVSGSRLVMLNKGLMSFAPTLIWLWLLMLINNLGVPPNYGILGELLLMISCLSYSGYIYIYLFIVVFFVSCFVINMYSFLVGGLSIYYPLNISLIVYYGAIVHLVPMNVFIFFVNCFI